MATAAVNASSTSSSLKNMPPHNSSHQHHPHHHHSSGSSKHHHDSSNGSGNGTNDPHHHNNPHNPNRDSQHSQHHPHNPTHRDSQRSQTQQQDSSSPTTSGSRKSKRERGARPQRQTSKYPSKLAIWMEPRLLKIATGLTMFGVLLQLIAISTDSWLIIENPDEVFAGNNTGTILVSGQTGLWRLCKVEIERKISPSNGKLVEEKHDRCVAHDLFPTQEESEAKKDYDRQHLDYTRTAIAFTIIALVITVIGHCFAFYALKRPRYIIKRLAALLHFMTAACLLVLNEVFAKTVEHERDNMPGRIPETADTHYGYSFVLSWLVFVFFVLAGMVFLFSSHKRKAEYADGSDALEDEPMEIFRR